jgi:hypothetical protein
MWDEQGCAPSISRIAALPSLSSLHRPETEED